MTRAPRTTQPRNPLIPRLGEEFFAGLPMTPGVYFMLDAQDRLLYVGKAKNLRARLRSYTRIVPGSPDADRAKLGYSSPSLRIRKRQYYEEQTLERLLELVSRIREIRWEDHPTEQAALDRESELLRGLRPPYNVAGTDEELYLYIGIRKAQRSSEKQGSCATSVDQTVTYDLRLCNEPDYTLEPDGEGYEVFGAYRNRGTVKRGYGALLRLLYAYQFAQGRFSYPGRISRDKPPWRYRAKIPRELERPLKDFLKGRSRRLLAKIFEGLLANESLPVFMRPSIQGDIEAAQALFEAGPGLTRKIRGRHAPDAGTGELVLPDEMAEWVRRDALASTAWARDTDA